jgi:hypothetical protein
VGMAVLLQRGQARDVWLTNVNVMSDG